MRYKNSMVGIVIAMATFANLSLAVAQSNEKIEHQLLLKAKSPAAERIEFRLLPTEAEQETGNAVPVLLRLPHEQQNYMANVFNKLGDFSELAVSDPKLNEITFPDSFAKQIIRAGNMSYADWEYPLDSAKPYMILLPDAQTQRQWVGRGMSVWIKQKLAQGDSAAALQGVRAQLSCGRHICQTPVIVCNLVGLAIAYVGLENLELAMQDDNTPNLYWSLAAMPNNLVDMGPMVRWENQVLLQSLPSVTAPLPPIGDPSWKKIADEFIQMMNEASESRYTEAEAAEVMANIDRLATKLLLEDKGFSQEQLEQTSIQERIMRWILIQHARFSAATEVIIHLPVVAAIQQKKILDAEHANILQQTKAKSSPFAAFQTNGIMACHRFGRHVRFLQTLESIRDYAASHSGKLPESLSQLDLPAPNDPFTDKPFLYEANGEVATLKWEDIPEIKYPVRVCKLRFK